MIIRKLFKFENAHIVRNCTTQRCSQSLHGHSYKVEVLLQSSYLDEAQMVYDFGLMKLTIKELIDAFDHSITLWDKDEANYIEDMKKHSQRWIVLPVSPSAEQFSRVIFLMVQKIIDTTLMVNGERGVEVHSIIVHETDTGYAQSFAEDAHSQRMGRIDLSQIEFSPQIQSEWSKATLWQDILEGLVIQNPNKI
ncbi:MAG: 6-carboxytetrahydropterin synthase [Campylobacterales bacterium]|nr:6-carboxytetrahydropterin synthase [Campylobacterales bacterium]